TLVNIFETKWSKSGLKNQLLMVGSGTTILSLSVVLALSLGFLLSITNNITHSAEEATSPVVSLRLNASVENMATSFQNEINKFGRSIVLFIGISAGDTFRDDQPFAAAAGIVVPLTGSRHLEQSISLNHSTYTIENYLGDTRPNLNSTLQAYVDASSHLDVDFRNLYSLFNEIISMACGFSNGIFRVYPGLNHVYNFSTTQRPWYLDAMGNPNSPFVITDPYNDGLGQGWMITLSTIIKSTSSHEQIGVAGADISLWSLKNNLQKLAVQNGTLSLYLINGTALLTPDWPLNATTYTPAPLYKQSISPPISDELWKEMISNKNLGIVQTSTSISDYLLFYMILNITNGRTDPSYLVISAYPKNNLSNFMDNVEYEMHYNLSRFVLISVVIFIAIIAIVTTSVIAISSAAAKPLDNLRNISERISNRLVNEGDDEDMEMIIRQVGADIGVIRRRFITVDNFEIFSERFYEMTKNLDITNTANHPRSVVGMNINSYDQNWTVNNYGSYITPPPYDQRFDNNGESSYSNGNRA
ncbi:VWFA and cache domain-containing protein 1, partial [Nowakowskiella sp. JEL0078]